jgi:hypothetical protein
MIDELKNKVNADETLVKRGRWLSTTFLMEVGTTVWLINIIEGRIASIVKGPFVMASWTFALRAPEEEWTKFWSPPQPGSHDLMALIKRRALKVEGDLQPFMANLRYFKEALVKLRKGDAA